MIRIALLVPFPIYSENAAEDILNSKAGPNGSTKTKIKLSYILIFVESVHSSVPTGVKIPTKLRFSFVETH